MCILVVCWWSGISGIENIHFTLVICISGIVVFIYKVVEGLGTINPDYFKYLYGDTRKISISKTALYNSLPKKQRIYDYFSEFASEALHIVIFENFVKSMTSCLSKLKVTPSFCFAFKIPDDVTASIMSMAVCFDFCSTNILQLGCVSWPLGYNSNNLGVSSCNLV